MMWINYQLKSWSHKSVVDLLCIRRYYSLDGKVNKNLIVQRRLVWYSVMFFNSWSKYKSKCRLSYTDMQARPTHTLHTNTYTQLMVWCTEMFAAHELFIYWIQYILIGLCWVCSCMIILLFHSSINIFGCWLGYTLIPDHCSSLVV